ncbi:MAG: hypothetical protein RI897_3585 [Verrucomicrobiota bacterium]
MAPMGACRKLVTAWRPREATSAGVRLPWSEALRSARLDSIWARCWASEESVSSSLVRDSSSAV